MTGNWRIFKKLHKWPGLIISFVLFYYAITGIFMNHREFFSGVDISRNILPQAYQYTNWNNAAVKGNLVISKDSILVYGNIGIWLTDSGFQKYTPFHSGLPKGSDHRKIFDVHRTLKGDLYAATLFGLYSFDPASGTWKRFNLDVDIKRFTGIESIGDTVYALNRSYLFKGKSAGLHTAFTRIEIPAPEDYDHRITLFETIWQLHSGEIFGLPGKLYVDLLGLVTLFLSVTGMVYFFFPGWIKHRLTRNKPSEKIIRVSQWTLKWHNHTGAWTFILLVILFFTGIFLRPPLLLAIANAKVAPLPYSHLDQPNPWYDKLRDIVYDKYKGVFVLSSSEGMYHMRPSGLSPVRFLNQPPVSVMGINTLEQQSDSTFLIGSFSGLFLWNPGKVDIYHFSSGKLFEDHGGRPVGEHAVTGTIRDVDGNQFMIDYSSGMIPLHHSKQFPGMPQNILTESKMSLWNVCLEIHTGRFFHPLTGNFYILIVPLAGLAGIMVVISGYFLWRRKYKIKRKLT